MDVSTEASTDWPVPYQPRLLFAVSSPIQRRSFVCQSKELRLSIRKQTAQVVLTSKRLPATAIAALALNLSCVHFEL
jgi:hypothetical protein